MADTQLFRHVWSKFATGVTVVTSIQPDGKVHGMAANGIASVSLEPQLVLICVGENRQSHHLIKQTRRFAISILSEEQQDIADYYAKPPEKRAVDEEPAFSFTEHGGAYVEDSLGSMDCHVVAEHEHGDHTIFIGEVDDIRLGAGRPLIYFDSQYDTLR